MIAIDRRQFAQKQVPHLLSSPSRRLHDRRGPRRPAGHGGGHHRHRRAVLRPGAGRIPKLQLHARGCRAGRADCEAHPRDQGRSRRLRNDDRRVCANSNPTRSCHRMSPRRKPPAGKTKSNASCRAASARITRDTLTQSADVRDRGELVGAGRRHGVVCDPSQRAVGQALADRRTGPAARAAG